MDGGAPGSCASAAAAEVPAEKEGPCGCAECAASPEIEHTTDQILRELGARELDARIGRRLRHLALLRREFGVQWERRERVEGGKVTERREIGDARVYHPEFGCLAPVDDEAAFGPDGVILHREDVTRSLGDGSYERISRTVRAGRTKVRCPDVHVAHAAASVRQEGLAELVEAVRKEKTVRLWVRLRDATPVRRLPSRVQTRPFRPGQHPGDAVTCVRVDRVRERVEARSRHAAGFTAWVESQGGRVRQVLLQRLFAVAVEVPGDVVERVAARPDVGGVSVVNAWEATPEAVSTEYACEGMPVRYLGTPPDMASCYENPATVIHFQDGVVTAMGGMAYADAGYDGARATTLAVGETWGLAAWAVGWEHFDASSATTVGGYKQVPHLVLGVDDDKGLDASHPAFLTDEGEYRTRYRLYDVGYGHDLTEDVGAITPTGSHGTGVAGIALGSVVDGQDDRVPMGDDAVARSGVARRAYMYFSSSGVATALDYVREPSSSTRRGNASDSTWAIEGVDGIDVFVSSASKNSNSLTVMAGRYVCPSADNARGLDPQSEAVVWAYLTDSIVYVKSAGNMHATGAESVRARCRGGDAVPYEVSAPGASPAAISVGALASGYRTPNEMQESVELHAESSGAKTPDGRSYPSLVVAASACGVPNWRSDGSQGYEDFGATSAAAPRVAGGALVFKHWYLENHGPEFANQAGRVISNVLNMADGVAFDGHEGGAGHGVPAPARPWGLGRFVMRLFEPSNMGGEWTRSTTSVTLTEDNPNAVVYLGGADDAPIPADARRLRITLWWLEVNTGRAEPKAAIAAVLYRVDAGAEGPVGYAETSTECCLRFTYECNSQAFDEPPEGTIHLIVQGLSLPKELRYLGRSHRVVYVSWFWETGANQAAIRCPGDAIRSTCDNRSTIARNFTIDTLSEKVQEVVSGTLDDVLANVGRGK